VPARRLGRVLGRRLLRLRQDQEHSSANGPFKKDYHQISDEYHPSWDLTGMVQQAQFTLNLGYAVGNAPEMQSWKAGDAFGKIKR
jgi:hypothetical protein